MAIRIKLVTTGLNDVLEALTKAGKNIDAATGRALEAGGEVLLDGMKRRVPKDTHNLEGHLNVDGPHQDGNFQYIEIGLNHADADTARYGTAQEYGTSSMAAQPYVRPTVDADMGKARKAMMAVLNEELTG